MLDLLQDLLKKVTSFQAKAREALRAEEPDSDALAKLMEEGVTLDIDLPELPRLKQVTWCFSCFSPVSRHFIWMSKRFCSCVIGISCSLEKKREK